MLTRIFHTYSTASPQSGMSTALRLFGLLARIFHTVSTDAAQSGISDALRLSGRLDILRYSDSMSLRKKTNLSNRPALPSSLRVFPSIFPDRLRNEQLPPLLERQNVSEEAGLLQRNGLRPCQCTAF